MARVAHSGMTADEVTENIEAAVQTVVAKLRMVRELSCVFIGFGSASWTNTSKISNRLNCLGVENLWTTLKFP